MRIAKLTICGFRNFASQEITFGDKTLLFGANDSGKSNLLYALRILFDPSFNSRHFELNESDFNVETNASSVEITAELTDVHEPCLLSAFRGDLKDGKVVISFEAEKGGEYWFLTGPTKGDLERHDSRSYIKHLCLEYVGSSRNVADYLKRTQSAIIEAAKNNRSDSQANEDEKSIKHIQEALEKLNGEIGDLHFISDSMKVINAEMTAIAAENEEYEAKLVAGNTDAGKLLDNLKLAYLQEGNPLTFGGDGRANQLFFATWLAQQRIQSAVEKIRIFAIEEPEAHLHPHQQRRLAEYLSNSIDEQVIISSHSPQIVERFVASSVVRLAKSANGTIAISSTESLGQAIETLGYRMNAILAEVFFANAVLLVEGSSEKILYQAIARSIGVDLDRMNCSILSVEGVGFVPYVLCCEKMRIPWIVRTDNDVFKKPKKDEYHLAGLKRAVSIAREIRDDDILDEWDKQKDKTHWQTDQGVPQEALTALSVMKPLLEQRGIFLAEHDLEHDLISSPIQTLLANHYGQQNQSDLYARMTERKAENMHTFISQNPDLSSLRESEISKPLNLLVKMASSKVAANDN